MNENLDAFGTSMSKVEREIEQVLRPDGSFGWFSDIPPMEGALSGGETGRAAEAGGEATENGRLIAAPTNSTGSQVLNQWRGSGSGKRRWSIR